MDAQHVNCLHQMGIEIWVSQQPLSGAAERLDCVGYQLYQVNNNVLVGTLLLQAIPATAAEQIKIQNLLQAMLFAVGMRAEAITKPVLQGKLVILGLVLAQKILKTSESLLELKQSCQKQNPSVLASYHPLELLRQLYLKAEVWQDLQQFLQYT